MSSSIMKRIKIYITLNILKGYLTKHPTGCQERFAARWKNLHDGLPRPNPKLRARVSEPGKNQKIFVLDFRLGNICLKALTYQILVERAEGQPQEHSRFVVAQLAGRQISD